ncbi:hypothetical protein [Streptomyces sp. NPDC018693]|uniref:hypothetical protein n=1 Tax=unclassified Streptomyces TaxID=2593676 RepID=UPI0037962625
MPWTRSPGAWTRTRSPTGPPLSPCGSGRPADSGRPGRPPNPAPLDDDTPVHACARLLAAPGDGARRYAANGNASAGPAGVAALAVLARLEAGEVVRVGELPVPQRAEVRHLLQELESFRAVTRSVTQ